MALPNFVKTGIQSESRSLIHLVTKGMSKLPFEGRTDRFYASDAGFCPRQAALKSRGGGEIDNPASFNAYCELGNTIEALVLGALTSTGNLLFKQYRIPDIGLNLGGKIDGIIVSDGKLRVLEIKSCGELPKTDPKPEHKAQALIYSAVTGLPASVLYFSRDVVDFKGSLMLKEFPLDDLVDEKRATIYRAALAYFSTRKGILPDIPSHLTTAKDCGHCPFKDFCWDGVATVTTDLKPPSGPEGEKLVEQATLFTENFFSNQVVADRRNGIIKHLQTNGGQTARDVLKGDWSHLL